MEKTVIVLCSIFFVFSCSGKKAIRKWYASNIKASYVEFRILNFGECSDINYMEYEDALIHCSKDKIETIRDTLIVKKIESIFNEEKLNCKDSTIFCYDLRASISFHYPNISAKRYFICCHNKLIINNRECEIKKSFVEKIVPFIKNKQNRISLENMKNALQ